MQSKSNIAETRKESTIAQSVSILDRKQIVITGVLELFSSNENEIKAKTSLGNLKIIGQKLQPNKLDLENKQLIVLGEIDGISYYGIANKKTFFKRLFK